MRICFYTFRSEKYIDLLCLKFISMDNIDFQDFDFSSTNRSRIKTCSKCKSAEHTITKCPMNPCGYCKLPGHISSSCLVKKQDIQARKRIRNMSPEQVEQQRVRHLVENMNPIQIDALNPLTFCSLILDDYFDNQDLYDRSLHTT